MDWFNEQLARECFGNEIRAYLIAAVVGIATYLTTWIAESFIERRVRRWQDRHASHLGGMLARIFGRIGPLVYFVFALYLAIQSLALNDSVARILDILFIVVLTLKSIQIVQEVISFLVERWVQEAEEEDPTGVVVVQNIMAIVRVGLWVCGAVFVLQNLGTNVTSLLTGLGVGGLAVAIAAQSILGDAFSSFAIFIDKPFKVGDFIIVGDFLGTVEHVGFKTTRLRSLSGEQVVFANTDLTGSRIRNYKRMESRRIVFKLGVVYQTPIEKVREVPGLIEQIVRAQELTRFDRAHFLSFGDFALIFEIVYFVLSPDYNKYMDVQQSINMKIMEAFKERDIEFAYPTQQLYVTQVQPAD